MKKTILSLFFTVAFVFSWGQKRTVYVDFESSSFKTNPSIPFAEPFMIQGEVYRQVEFVEVQIHNEHSDKVLHSYTWNRDERNQSEKFEIVIPAVLISNSKYDFSINTFRKLDERQKVQLSELLRERVEHYISSVLYFDGRKVILNKPDRAYKELNQLVQEALQLYRSKNSIEKPKLSKLIGDELKKNSEFQFKYFLRNETGMEKDSLSRKLIQDKVSKLSDMIMSEVQPYLNSELVQMHHSAYISSVATDKEPFTLPVNFGIYAWSKSVDINNTNVNNIDFTPGIGFSIPFSNKSSLLANSKQFDSFGFSMGVLLNPVQDANGNEYITPGINIPLYTGLGLRIFKVARLNAGILILADRGIQDFSGITILPTAALALELNAWLGIKK